MSQAYLNGGSLGLDWFLWLSAYAVIFLSLRYWKYKCPAKRITLIFPGKEAIELARARYRSGELNEHQYMRIVNDIFLNPNPTPSPGSRAVKTDSLPWRKADEVKYSLGVLLVVFLFQGCAHSQVERRVDAKVARETQVTTRSQVNQEAKSVISAAIGLSEEQRAKLRSLQHATQIELDALNNQSLRLRSLLIKDLVEPKYDEEEVFFIKEKIRDVENRRVSSFFDATDRVNEIVGRQAVNDRKLLSELISLVVSGPAQN